MEEVKKLSNKELHEEVKQFWGDLLPAYETFEKCGSGMRSDNKKEAWFIRQTGNTIRLEVFSHAALKLMDCGVLTYKNGEWVRTT